MRWRGRPRGAWRPESCPRPICRIGIQRSWAPILAQTRGAMEQGYPAGRKFPLRAAPELGSTPALVHDERFFPDLGPEGDHALAVLEGLEHVAEAEFRVEENLPG